MYAAAEPNVLRTVSSLVDFLILIHKSQLDLSPGALVKLNSISKSVCGRFPLTCSVPNRDTSVVSYLLSFQKQTTFETFIRLFSCLANSDNARFTGFSSWKNKKVLITRLKLVEFRKYVFSFGV